MAGPNPEKLHALLREQGEEHIIQAFFVAQKHGLRDPVILLIDLKTDQLGRQLVQTG
jgi:hypothetical protein